MKLWSISTTVRNPNRIREFLRVLKTIETEEWNKATQEKYQILLLQNKLYGFDNIQFYSGLPDKYIKHLNSGSLSYNQAKQILNFKNYVGGEDMRGRQSFNPLKKMGFAYIDEDNKIIISELGNYFLKDKYDLGEIFFRCLLKWQYPNPNSTKYKSEEGYNIKPFIATLHLIDKVNRLCKEKKLKAKGVSHLEFAMFFTSLINYKNITERAKEIINFRFEVDKIKDEETKKSFIENYFSTNFYNFESFDNAIEYADNIIRYFRLTRYLYIRGNGWYIDIEPRRSVEINTIIEWDDASATEFQNKQEYFKYLGSVSQPELPWQTEKKLLEIIDLQLPEIIDKQNQLHNLNIKFEEIQKLKKPAKIEDLISYSEYIRAYRKELSDLLLLNKSDDIEIVRQYIERFSDMRKFEGGKKGLELEKSVVLGLNAIDDAIKIKPNYPVGDDNEPTFTAPPNVPDIESFYESFNSICEVTLTTNRQQWYYEGQPVMRHMRDFELKYPNKETFCLFIAPKLHRDTINTFWYATKYEYEGKKQRIVPLTISQFKELLCILYEIKNRNKRITHNDIKELYREISDIKSDIKKSEDWLKTIPCAINNWKENLVN